MKGTEEERHVGVLGIITSLLIILSVPLFTDAYPAEEKTATSTATALVEVKGQRENPKPLRLDFTMTRTWDNRTTEHEFKFRLSVIKDAARESQNGLEIFVRGPLFNDPKVPPSTPQGSVDKLWQYEVLELFLVGQNGNYLEVELAPYGRYLVLLLDSERNVLRYKIPLKWYGTRESFSFSSSNFTAKKSKEGEEMENFITRGSTTGTRGRKMTWEARALVSFQDLPQNVTKFNAYGIHKSDPDRVFMAYHPVPTGKYSHPDFHRVQYFQDIHLNL